MTSAVARDPRPVSHVHPPARLLPVVGQDLQVPLVTGERARYVNLDTAASAPCLQVVQEAVAAALPWYGSVHRGAGFTSQASTALLASARAEVGAFVGARPGDEVVFTRHTTDALNLLAAALPEDTGVVSFSSEHHANLLPWRRFRHVELTVPERHDLVVASAVAALRAMPTRHKLLAVTGASNVTGELWPVAALCTAAHAVGARVVVDAAQLAPHRRIDLVELGADWVALSAHKLYAPFGCGALVGRADWLDAAPPYLDGGGAVQKVTLEGTQWATGPARHEAGTPNLLGAVAFAAACKAISQEGWDRVVAHEAALLDQLVRGLKALPGVEVLSLWGAGSPRIGVVAFTVKGWSAGKLAAALSAEHGVGLRDGAFCAHPLVATLVPAQPGEAPAALRASVGAGTSGADLERLLSALEQLIANGPRWTYRLDRGRWVPENDPRPLPTFGFGAAEAVASPCAAPG